MRFPRSMGALVRSVEADPLPEALVITANELALTDGECHKYRPCRSGVDRGGTALLRCVDFVQRLLQRAIVITRQFGNDVRRG